MSKFNNSELENADDLNNVSPDIEKSNDIEPNKPLQNIENPENPESEIDQQDKVLDKKYQQRLEKLKATKDSLIADDIVVNQEKNKDINSRDFLVSEPEAEEAWRNQKLSNQTVEVDQDQERERERDQKQEQEREYQRDQQQENQLENINVNIPTDNLAGFDQIKSKVAIAPLKTYIMQEARVSEERANKLAEDFNKVKDQEIDRAVKFIYLKRCFDTYGFEKRVLSETVLKEIEKLSGQFNSKEDEQKVIDLANTHNLQIETNDIWENLSRSSKEIKRSNKSKITNQAYNSFVAHDFGVDVSIQAKFAEHEIGVPGIGAPGGTPNNNSKSSISEKIANNLINTNPDTPGIKYLSQSALKEVVRNSDYFSDGIIDNKDPLSLPPGFVMGEHPDKPGEMILHYDQSIEKDMYLAQQKRKQEGVLFTMDHNYFPNDQELKELWDSNNKHYIPLDTSSKYQGKEYLVEKFFKDNGEFKFSKKPESHNFNYYSNSTEAQNIFKDKLTALSDKIDSSFADDPEKAGKINEFIYDNIISKRKDLSGFIEGRELAAINRIIDMPDEKLNDLYDITIRPLGKTEKTISFSEIEGAYSSYTNFVQNLDVTKDKKDKLLHIMPVRDRGQQNCNITYNNPYTSLARMQYIISSSSNPSEQIDVINGVKLSPYDSAFYMKRYNDISIVTSDFNSIARFTKKEYSLSNDEILKKSYELAQKPDYIHHREDIDLNDQINASVTMKCGKENILKERLSGRNNAFSELTLLTNVGYMISMFDKESSPLEKKDHMNRIVAQTAYHLNDLSRVEADGNQNATLNVKTFLLRFTEKCFEKELVGGQETVKLSSNIRSVNEMHTLLDSVIPTKEVVIKDAGWIDTQIDVMSDIMEASKNLEGENRRHFFAALKFTDDPAQFAKNIQNLEVDSPRLASDIWTVALKGSVNQDDKILSKNTLDALNDIHALNKIEVKEIEDVKHGFLIERSASKNELYDVIASVSEDNKDVKSFIQKNFNEKNYNISYSEDFRLNPGLVKLKSTMLANEAFTSIENDLKLVRKREDIVKAIGKYEEQYAETSRKTYQNTQEDIVEIDNILARISSDKNEKVLDSKALEKLDLDFTVSEAILYKMGRNVEGLSNDSKQFLDSISAKAVISNPKSIPRLMELQDRCSEAKGVLEQNGGLYATIAGDTNNIFKSSSNYDVPNKLYEIVVNSNLEKFPQEKASILSLSDKMSPSSFAMLTAKIEEGPAASKTVDLMIDSYKRNYEKDIEKFVERASEISKLDSKQEQSEMLKWAMEKNVSKEKLNEIVETCSNNKHLPAKEIIKLDSRISMYDVANPMDSLLKDLENISKDEKMQSQMLKLSNSIGLDPTAFSSTIYQGVDKEKKKDLSSVLINASSADSRVNKKEVIDLVNVLKKTDTKDIQNLVERYENKEIYANTKVLTEALNSGNLSKLETDPHGRRTSEKAIDQQFSIKGVVEKINSFKMISSNDKNQRVEDGILKNQKKELLEDFMTVNKFGKDHVRHLDKKGLQDLAQNYRDILQDDSATKEDKKQAQLGYMAVSREAMYRVSGKFAYSTQMLAIMNNFSQGTHVVNEVQTGQGKSVISAISASILSANGYSVDVCTSNMDLAKRDIEESADFFDYVGTKYAKDPISQNSSKEAYVKGGINYSTIPDLSLYEQNISLEPDVANKEPVKKALVADEFDAAANMTTIMRLAKPKEMLDKATDSQYKNVYEGANAFIDHHKDDLKDKNMGELVALMQEDIKNNKYAHFGIQDQGKWNKFVDNLAKYSGAEEGINNNGAQKMGELISAAYQASNLKQGQDFRVVTQEVQTKDGIEKVSTAKVLANSLITDNVYSGGVHQCLHSRLEHERQNGKGKAAHRFVVSAESEVVSSQTVKNFMDGYDRLNGYTGTYGFGVELSGYSSDIQAFQVPKHQAHNRKDLEPRFAKDKESHIKKVNEFVSKLSRDSESRQPVLIVCENDKEAKAMYEAISKIRPNEKIQMVDSIKKDIEPETIEASKKGMITISTPRMSRGTDIKPQHEKGLCVITSYADFRRVEGQIQGRSGRQDAKGVAVQIIDEQDLKQKLENSTGQPITDKGKKLLKKYHHNLEQQNLSNVQDKQLEGDLRKAYILLKQNELKEQQLDKKAVSSKLNKEFSDNWKDLKNKHSGNVSEIKEELFKNHNGLEDKLKKVQEAKSNREILKSQEMLTKNQKEKSNLKRVNLKDAKKYSDVKVDILIRKTGKESQEIASNNVSKEYLKIWSQNLNKQEIKSLSAREVASIKPNENNLDDIKKNIATAITNYRDHKSHSLSSGRKESVGELLNNLNKAESIQEVYAYVKQAQQSQINADIDKGSMLSNRKGSKYQNVLNNAMDKIVVTGAIEYNNQIANKEIEELVNNLPNKSRVKQSVKIMASMGTDKAGTQDNMKLKLIESKLSADMKKFNSNDRVAAQSILEKIDRTNLKTKEAAKQNEKSSPGNQQRLNRQRSDSVPNIQEVINRVRSNSVSNNYNRQRPGSVPNINKQKPSSPGIG